MSENPDSNFCTGYGIAEFLQSAKKLLDQAEQFQHSLREAGKDLDNAEANLEIAMEYKEEIGPNLLKDIQDDLRNQKARLQELQEQTH